MVFTTMIPTRRNDGSPVEKAELDEIIQGLWMKFGGITIDGVVTGHWIDRSDDKHYQDESLKVSVACDNSRLDEVEQAVKEIGRRLGQIEMYLDIRYLDGVRFLKT